MTPESVELQAEKKNSSLNWHQSGEQGIMKPNQGATADAHANRKTRIMQANISQPIEKDKTSRRVPDAPSEDSLVDNQLMRRISAGDQRAFQMLMRRHLPNTIRLGLRILRNQADAEEVAQEAFTRVWTHATRWDETRARFTTWLYRITYNLCIDRTRKRTHQPLDDVPMPVDEINLNSFEEVHGQQIGEHLEQALRKLPENQAAAITLCTYQGMSNAEAADILGLSVKAVESLLVRARRRLREDLKPIYEDVKA